MDKLQTEIAAFQTIQKGIFLAYSDYDKAVQNRTLLESQLKENEQVQNEFSLLAQDSQVYKLIGPCLVKHDQTEAKSNVSKRIEFIQGEMYFLKIDVENDRNC
jgi:prefoldin beta subunit